MRNLFRRAVLVLALFAAVASVPNPPPAEASIDAASLVARSRQEFRELTRALERIDGLRQEFDQLTDDGASTTFLSDYFTAEAPNLDITFAEFVQGFRAVEDMNATLDAAGDVTLPTRPDVRRKSLYRAASNR